MRSKKLTYISKELQAFQCGLIDYIGYRVVSGGIGKSLHDAKGKKLETICIEPKEKFLFPLKQHDAKTTNHYRKAFDRTTIRIGYRTARRH